MNSLYSFYDKWLIPAIAALMILGYPTSVNALSDTLGKVRAYQITCDVTPVKMCNSGYCSYSAFKFSVPAASTVFLGGSDVNTTTKGFPYAGAITDSWDVQPGVVWCAAAAPVTVTVIAGGK